MAEEFAPYSVIPEVDLLNPVEYELSTSSMSNSIRISPSFSKVNMIIFSVSRTAIFNAFKSPPCSFNSFLISSSPPENRRASGAIFSNCRSRTCSAMSWNFDMPRSWKDSDIFCVSACENVFDESDM